MRVTHPEDGLGSGSGQFGTSAAGGHLSGDGGQGRRALIGLGPIWGRFLHGGTVCPGFFPGHLSQVGHPGPLQALQSLLEGPSRPAAGGITFPCHVSSCENSY